MSTNDTNEEVFLVPFVSFAHLFVIRVELIVKTIADYCFLFLHHTTVRVAFQMKKSVDEHSSRQFWKRYAEFFLFAPDLPQI